MPFPTLAVPPYPDVPAGLPGVPSVSLYPSVVRRGALSGGVGGLPTSLSTLIAPQGQLLPAAFAPPVKQQWGIYAIGAVVPVIKPDSIFSVDVREDRRISNYPQEQGGFASYNKVFVPFAGRVRMTKSGSVSDKAAFLTLLRSLKNDTNLYSLMMPEASYQSCNIVHYDLVRTAKQGAQMLTVDVWVEEVNNSVTQTYSNTALPSAGSAFSAGPVPPLDATAAQLAQFGTPALPAPGDWISRQVQDLFGF